MSLPDSYCLQTFSKLIPVKSDCTPDCTSSRKQPSGTIEPTASPVYVSMTDMGGCPDGWTPADASAGPVDLYYEGGDRVSAGGLVFECREWPLSAYCGQTL